MTTSFTLDGCRLDRLRALVEQQTDPDDYPHADRVTGNVPIYRTVRDTPELRAELAAALLDGPGLVVFENAFAPDVVDRASAVFAGLIVDQKDAGRAAGDHFAKP